MRAQLAASLLLAGCTQLLGVHDLPASADASASDTGDGAPSPWLEPFQHRIAIELPASTPVSTVIRVTASVELAGDLRVTTLDNSVLPQEPIERDAGLSSIWARVPGLPAQLWLYFDGAARSDPPSPWDEYEGVWHFESTLDSTGHGHPVGMFRRIAGVDGSCMDLTGEIDVHDTEALDFAASSFTLSLWVRVPNAQDASVSLVRSAPHATAVGYALELASGKPQIRMFAGPGNETIATGGDLVAGRWTMTTVTFDRATNELRMYQDGALVQQVVATDGVGTAAGYVLGSPTGSVEIDELVAAPRAWTAAEVQAAYRNLSDAMFQTTGAVENHP